MTPGRFFTHSAGLLALAVVVACSRSPGAAAVHPSTAPVPTPPGPGPGPAPAPVTSAAPAVLDEAARLARVEAILVEQQEKLHIPGLAVVVVEGDRIVLLKGFGLRDVARELPVTADTRFPIGSCTKAFTAVALAVAQDEGRLTFDDSPRRFLPYFRMQDPEADALVTLRDMLSHRTGLLAKADLAAEPAVLTREEYVQVTTAAKPSARLRERFQYSNAMFVAAGEVLAAVYRSTWEAAVTEHLLTPLGMSSSLARAHDMGRTADHATGHVYVAESRTWRPVPVPRSLQALGPAGGIASTARDMARWLRLIAGDGTVDGKRIVSAAGLREVMTPQSSAGKPWSYGLGWGLYEWNGHRVVEHNGGSAGISAVMSVMPDRGLGFALLANTSPTSLTTMQHAGELLWPVLTGEVAPTTRPSTVAPTPPGEAATPPADAPALDDLLRKMAEAAGGPRNLRRHATMEVRARRTYDNQGILADVRTRRAVPDRFVEEERWTAAGKRIGTVRIFLDGARGGFETSFGQGGPLVDEELDGLRHAARREEILDLRAHFTRVALIRSTTVGDEPGFVLEAVSAGGTRELLTISARTHLVIQRERGGETSTYSDFRNIDGEVLPFHVVTRGALGESTTRVTSVRFGGPPPGPEAFAPPAIVGP